MVKPVVLLILDGWGLNEEQENNAIKLANTPNYDEIIRTYPMTSLQTSGLAVGLPEGQMGNSEVGHLNIGSGRVVYQDLTRIDKAIEDGSLYENPVLVENMALAVGQGKAIHLIGLLSDGGVHSHIRHAKALIKMAKEKGCQKLYFHGLLDGRDVPPKSAKQYIDELESYMKEVSLGSIATIQGRYYAMDRDNRWDRVELGYQAIANGQGLSFSTSIEALEDSYQRDVVDEFVLPSVIGSYQGMADGDSIILFNFRGDRAREISQVFYKEDFQGFETRPLRINYVCMTEYDENLGAPIAFPPEKLTNTIGEYLSSKGIHQVRIAETEKYAHVTFFFNGGEETSLAGEERILVSSPKVATYDLQPEMSAIEVTDKVVAEITAKNHDVIILNFANCDMVGHTGVMSAAVKAVETVDTCLGRVVAAMQAIGGAVFITADHGNAELMEDPVTHGPFTAHTTNKVPFVAVGETLKGKTLQPGSLADIAPTILTFAGVTVPAEMTGKSLIK